MKPKSLRKYLSSLGAMNVTALLQLLEVRSEDRQDKLTEKMTQVWTYPLTDEWKSLTDDQLNVNLFCKRYILHGVDFLVIPGESAANIAKARATRGLGVNIEAIATSYCDPTVFNIYDSKLWERKTVGVRAVGELEQSHIDMFKKVGVKVVKRQPK